MEKMPNPRFNLRLIFCFVAFFLFFILLAGIFRPPVTSWMSAAYRLIWFDLFGAHYKLPLETPKPLMAFLCGVLPDQATYFISSLLMALWLTAMLALSRAMTGKYFYGGLAAVLCVFANTEILPAVFLAGYSSWTGLYIPLVFAQFLLLFREKYGACFFLNFLTSLIRPESWVFAVIFYAWLYWHKQARPVYLAAMLAPLAWMVFDWRLSGDPFFSYQVTRTYALVSELRPTAFFSYWKDVAAGVSFYYGPGLVLIGAAAFLLNVFKKGPADKTNIPGLCALSTFLGYWLVSLKGDLVMMNYFFSCPALILVFYASLLPALFSPVKTPHFRWYYGVLIAAVFFEPVSFGLSAQAARLFKIRQAAVQETTQYLRDHIGAGRLIKRVIIPAPLHAYYSLALGPEVSQRLVSFREAASDSYAGDLAGAAAVYVDLGGRTTAFLALPQDWRVAMAGKVFILRPVFKSRNGWGLVYLVYPAGR